MALLTVIALAACGTSNGDDDLSTDEESPADEVSANDDESVDDDEALDGITRDEDGRLQPLADGFPDQPITLWSAFSAGHQDDLLNRVVADIASDYSPVTVTSEAYEAGPAIAYGLAHDYLPNLPGADDGYHIYVGNWTGIAVRPWTAEPAIEYDHDSLHPILGLMERGNIFTTRFDSRFETLEDLEEAAREQPGVLRRCGTPVGTASLSVAVWADDAGIELVLVPLEGTGEARNVLLGGGCEISVWAYAEGVDQEVNVLAVTTDERIDELPDVPTLSELGYQGLGGALHGYGVLPEVSEERREWLIELLTSVVEDERFHEAHPGADIRPRSGDEIREAMDQELNAFFPLLEEMGIAVKDR